MAKYFDYYDTIAITGNRDYADPAALFRGLDRIGARQYFLGGARGIDTEALKYIAQTQKESIITVVVPNTIGEQPLDAQAAIKQFATNIIEMKNTGPDRFQLRNELMVDMADKTLGFYDFRGYGGTHNTIEYARSQGKLLEVHPLVEFYEEQILKKNLKEALEWIVEMRKYKVSLPAIKQILLKLMFKFYENNVREFAEDCGYPGCTSLEELWQY